MRVLGGGAAVLRAVAVLIALAVANMGSAHADTRVALVIGNSAYQNVAPLTNPTGDAQAIAGTLKGLGFDTMLALDQDGAGLKQALRSFAAKAKRADIAAVYYEADGAVKVMGTLVVKTQTQPGEFTVEGDMTDMTYGGGSHFLLDATMTQDGDELILRGYGSDGSSLHYSLKKLGPGKYSQIDDQVTLTLKGM
jgi:hypothetical protein